MSAPTACEVCGRPASGVPAVHLVVVAYNSSGFLDRCLRSARPQVTDAVVVDNSEAANEQASTKAVAGAHDTRYVSAGTNTGFASAANLGAELACLHDGDWLWFLNPDTEADPTCVAELLSRGTGLRLALLSPLITTGERQDRVWFAGGDLDLRAGVVAHRGFGERPGDTEVSRACTFVTGAAAFVSVPLWRALHGFRPDLFLYWEDVDLSHRATALGAVLEVVPDARVWHHVGGSGGTAAGMSREFHFYMQRNRYVLMAEHLGSPLRPLVTGARAILRSLAIAVLREPTGRLVKFRASASGLRAGVRAARSGSLPKDAHA